MVADCFLIVQQLNKSAQKMFSNTSVRCSQFVLILQIIVENTVLNVKRHLWKTLACFTIISIFPHFLGCCVLTDLLAKAIIR